MGRRNKTGKGSAPEAGVTEKVGDEAMTTQVIPEDAQGVPEPELTAEQLAAKSLAESETERLRLELEQQEINRANAAALELEAAKLEDERKAAEDVVAAEALKKSNPMFKLIEERRELLGRTIGRVERLGLEKNMADMAVMANDFTEVKHIEMFVAYLKDNLHSISPISVALNGMRMTTAKVLSVHAVFAALHTMAMDRRYGRKSTINDAEVKKNVNNDVVRRWILGQL